MSELTIAADQTKFPLSTELLFLWDREMDWGRGRGRGVEWINKRLSQSGQVGKGPPHICITVKPPERLRMEEALLKACKEDKTTYKLTGIRLVSDFSVATWNARGLWKNKSKSLRKHEVCV